MIMKQSSLKGLFCIKVSCLLVAIAETAKFLLTSYNNGRFIPLGYVLTGLKKTIIFLERYSTIPMLPVSQVSNWI